MIDDLNKIGLWDRIINNRFSNLIFDWMNIQKRQSVQKLVIDQAGRERLILNDLILGYDGAETVAELIPQYHPGLCHLEIKGNNIDSDGFEVIFAALANCPNLKSI